MPEAASFLQSVNAKIVPDYYTVSLHYEISQLIACAVGRAKSD